MDVGTPQLMDVITIQDEGLSILVGTLHLTALRMDVNMLQLLILN